MVRRRYVLAWFGLLIIAVANGALREAAFAEAMSELAAHQLSTLIGSTALGVAIWFIVRTWPPASSAEALGIGLAWLVLTVAFEFFMGLVLAGRPLSDVLAAYDVQAGRVWVFLLIWIALAPLLFYRLSGAKDEKVTL